MNLLYDIEVFPNLFLCIFKDYKRNEYIIYEVSNRINQIEDFKDYCNYGITNMIGFNNLNYDYPVIHNILTNKISTNDEIYKKSQEIISQDYSFIPYKEIRIPQIDLMRIWHFNNKAKMTSLKALEVAMKMKDVRDLPYSPHKYLLPHQIDEVIEYCKNDLEATHKFLDITAGRTNNPLYKGQNKFKLRTDIQKEFGINCINWNDVKIGEGINKKIYSEISGRDWHDFKDLRTKRNSINLSDCIASYIEFQTKELNSLLNDIRSTTIHNTKGDFEKGFIFDGVKYKIALGGIHSVDKPRKLICKNGWKLCEDDVASMYPATVINNNIYPEHLGEDWLKGYTKIFNDRIKAKHEGKKLISDTFKLSLNGGGYGKTNEESSWMYDPLVTMRVTITGQLSLLMLIEMYSLIGVKTLSANTDGVVIEYPENRESEIIDIRTRWQEITKYELETTYYNKLIQTTVNDYIAEKSNGKVKYKGDFEIDKEIHKNHSMRIVRIALSDYFLKGVPIEDTIINHKDIFDFCLLVKINRAFIGELHTIKITNGIAEKEIIDPGKNIRYYISNTSTPLYKRKIETNKLTAVNKGFSVTLFNKYEEKDMKDYNINYNFYIIECRKIINRIESNQLELF